MRQICHGVRVPSSQNEYTSILFGFVIDIGHFICALNFNEFRMEITDFLWPE